jgi:hypothetical protein
VSKLCSILAMFACLLFGNGLLPQAMCEYTNSTESGLLGGVIGILGQASCDDCEPEQQSSEAYSAHAEAISPSELIGDYTLHSFWVKYKDGSIITSEMLSASGTMKLTENRMTQSIVVSGASPITVSGTYYVSGDKIMARTDDGFSSVLSAVWDGTYLTTTVVLPEYTEKDVWKKVGATPKWVEIYGVVNYGIKPVCSMVLANGQHMFTCSGDGSFKLRVPLDKDGKITLFSFCSGLSPFRTTIYPEDGEDMVIALQKAEPGQGMDIDYDFDAVSATKATISGRVTYKGAPVCSMVLANGQHMFTCSGDGSFSLNVPLDSKGGITFFSFCSGLPPFRYDFSAEEIY